MSPGRLAKSLMRLVSVSWRERPSQTDIDALEDNIERVGLVVRVRWAIVVALSIFSVIAVGIYAAAGTFGGLWGHMVLPGVALGAVLLYNAYYQMNYRRFGNIAVFNIAALLLDILVVTILVYYSGGVYSWFGSMYLLFVLEAALVLPSSRQVWAIAIAAIVAYSTPQLLVLAGVLPHVRMPLVANDLQGDWSYVAVRVLWMITLLSGAASVATLLMDQVRRRLSELAATSIRDVRTGLYDRTYFRHALALDIERARRFERGVSVVLADIDNLDRLNETFGFDAGNSMIEHVARAIEESVSAGPSGPDELACIARYSGEEFAIFMPERALGDTQVGEALAERIRVTVGDLRDDDRSVTVSVGVAGYPTQGRTAPELIGAADGALSAAYAAGGNRVAIGRIGSAGTVEP